MSMTSESDERMIIPNNGIGSPSTDDANSSGAHVGNHGPLKKGPWTSAEDAILVEYVTKHGEGNWNAVQKHSGLARCGKSCRLRWANHLRPDLKKGAFTPEEEHRIIELHAKMGNKWARMAAELPGRTDNEIKNFWNTRIKRRQRAGLPIYPPDICFQSPNGNQQLTDDPNTFSPGDGPHPDVIPVYNTFKIPPVEFKGLGFNHHFHPQALNFPDILPGTLLTSQGFNPSSFHNKSVVSTFHQPKRLRGPDPLFSNAFVSGSQLYQSDCTVPISKYSVFSQYDHNPNSNYTSNVYELPSLQTQMDNGGLPSSPPLPFYESVDILIQTPPDEHGSSSSCHLSPSNSGLLEEVLHESETLKSSSANHGSPCVHDETRWSGAYDDEGLSPLGHHSSPSVFSENSPFTPFNENSLDEPRLGQDLPVIEVASNLDPTQYEDKVETANQLIFSRPDYLLASNCLVSMKCPTTNDHFLLENAMGKLLGDDLSKDCKQVDTGTSSSAKGRVHDSCAWNPMPTV